MVIALKNSSNTNKVLRPYRDRNQMIKIPQGGTVEINLDQCRQEVKNFPKLFFGKYHCEIVKHNVTPKKVVEQEQSRPVAPKQAEPLNQNTVTQVPVDRSETDFKFRVTDGEFRQFNLEIKSWQKLKNLSEKTIGRPVYDENTQLYYLVKRIDGNFMFVLPIGVDKVQELTGGKL